MCVINIYYDYYNYNIFTLLLEINNNIIKVNYLFDLRLIFKYHYELIVLYTIQYNTIQVKIQYKLHYNTGYNTIHTIHNTS